MSNNLSKQKKISEILLKIIKVPDPNTEPGDIIFFITSYLNKTAKEKAQGKYWRRGIWERIPGWKPWIGFDRDDLDEWHVGIYYIGKKRKDHKRINQWIIHSTKRKGVHIGHIVPGNFTNENSDVRHRMEILRFEGINEKRRKIIVDFAYSRVGSEFDRARRSYKMLPYVFGLPNVFHCQDQFSCQNLVIVAYTAAGIYFPHPYKAFPIFNIGRYLGHPLGHPKDRVDPRSPYLMDHHIYRDPRFVLKAAVYQDPSTNEIILQTENLKKYSWNESLREKYIKKGYLDP